MGLVSAGSWDVLGSVWAVAVCAVVGLVGLKWLAKRANWWLYESKLGEEQNHLPPGDMGWPLIGTMWTFLRAFKSSNPDSFTSDLVKRYGPTGIYKTFMFGSPSVIVTKPETMKRVMTDDDAFMPGWPKSTVELMGKKSFVSISYEEHKRLRKLTAAPINGYDALCVYLKYIEEIVVIELEKWSKMGKIEFLTRLRKLTFKIIMHIFLGEESEPVMEALEKEYTALNYGVRAMTINIPGFAYHKALKARKNLVAVLQSIVDDRRNRRKNHLSSKGKDMMDHLLDAVDEKGDRLGDEDIVDILLMYLNAGHESSGHTMMWAAVLLQKHPEIFKRVKEEQEMVVKKRPSTQKGLNLKEIREMKYLDQVIDETLRYVSFSLMVFREAKTDVNINGYLIPKGWKALAWFRSVHMDPEIYPNPKEFNPSRWEGHTPKPCSFVPFGAGTRLCPGNDLAKLEIAIFLHYFVPGYEMERLNPKSPLRYLPHTRPIDNCLAIIKKLN